MSHVTYLLARPRDLMCIRHAKRPKEGRGMLYCSALLQAHVGIDDGGQVFVQGLENDTALS